jgi:hypothetical protein
MQLEPAPPQCSDGIDNDGDGLIDYPADPGCASAADLDEHSPTLPCDDGVDNDGDGLIDYRADGTGDPGCASPASPTESPACNDGIDNDGDGLIDYPNDPGCVNAASNIENPACQDGIDNDGDGKIDFDGGASANHGVPLGPRDPECGTTPYRTYETATPPCGLGAELVVAVPMVMWLRGRRRRRSS